MHLLNLKKVCNHCGLCFCGHTQNRTNFNGKTGVLIQVAIGVFLLLLLLLVLVLLLTEVVTDDTFSSQPNNYLHGQQLEIENKSRKGKNKTARYLLFSLCCITGISLCLYFISKGPESIESSPLFKTNASQSEKLDVQKNFVDSSAGYSLQASLQTKWVEGKLFGKANLQYNSTDSLPAIGLCSFYLLDADGYLLKKFDLTAADFLIHQTPEGRTIGYTAQVNAPFSFTDYQRLSALKLVLDRKLVD